MAGQNEDVKYKLGVNQESQLSWAAWQENSIELLWK